MIKRTPRIPMRDLSTLTGEDAETARRPMVSSSWPRPNCVVPNRTSQAKSAPVTVKGDAHGHTTAAHRKAESDAAGSMSTWR